MYFLLFFGLDWFGGLGGGFLGVCNVVVLFVLFLLGGFGFLLWCLLGVWFVFLGVGMGLEGFFVCVGGVGLVVLGWCWGDFWFWMVWWCGAVLRCLVFMIV